MLELSPHTRTQAIRRRRHWLIAASTIDRPNSAHSSISCVFELKGLKRGVVCYFQGRIFNLTNLLNHVAPSVELMMQM